MRDIDILPGRRIGLSISFYVTILCFHVYHSFFCGRIGVFLYRTGVLQNSTLYRNYRLSYKEKILFPSKDRKVTGKLS